MSVLTYAYPDFTAYTKIQSAAVNSKFTAIATVLNSTNILPRNILVNGGANEVLINDGSGVITSEARLAKTRGGTGYDLTTQPLELPAITTPSTPATGFGRVYFKADGYLYQLNQSGTETKVGAGGVGGINYVSGNPDAESGVTGWNTYSSNKTATITIASPAVITVSSTGGLSVGDGVIFTTTGALPTGLSPSTLYYVSGVLSGTTYKVSATLGGADVNTSGSQSGTHSVGIIRPIQGSGGTATGTFTRSASSPLRGTGSFLWTHGTIGDGVSYDFTIDSADKAKVLVISFDYHLSAGITDGDYTVYIVDITNGTVTQPTPFKVANTLTNGRYYSTFQTASNSTSYRVCFHQSAVSTVDVTFDNVSIGPQNIQYGAPITDWISFTPVLTSTGSAPAWGTTTTNAARWRRIGDTMELRWDVAQTVAGTSGTGSYLLSLPPGFSIDTNKMLVTSGAGASATGYASLGFSGGVYEGQTQTYDSSHIAVQFLNLAGAAGAVLNFGAGDTPLGFSAAINLTAVARVPIQGWGSSVVMSNDSDTRVVAARGYAPSTLAVTANSPIVWPNTDFDTHGGFSGGRYTVQVPGYYRVHLQLYSSTATNTMIYKNGAVVSEGSATTASSPAAVTDMLQLVAGDIIDARTNGSVTLGSGTGNVNHFTIERLSGPAAIAASETIAAKYYMSASGAPGANVAFNFDTKVFDTHGAVTTGAGWKFTAPVAGFYEVSAVAQATGATQTSVYLSVNGVNSNYLSQTSVANSFASGTTLVKLNAGDYIDVKPDSGVSYAGGSAVTWCSIRKVGN